MILDPKSPQAITFSPPVGATPPPPVPPITVTSTPDPLPSLIQPEKVDLNTLYSAIKDQQKKIDEMYLVVEKMRKASVRSMWLTIIFVVMPIILSVFALPYLMSTYMGTAGVDTNSGEIQKLLESGDFKAILQKAQSGGTTE
jgi:hypothetical protein